MWGVLLVRLMGMKKYGNEYVDLDNGETAIFMGDFVTIIDTEDVPRAKAFHWRAGTKKPYVMGLMYHGLPSIFLSRLIMSFPVGFMVDHVDRNTLDNTKKNLRIATSRENSTNRTYKPNRSGFRGGSPCSKKEGDEIHCLNHKSRKQETGMAWSFHHPHRSSKSL